MYKIAVISDIHGNDVALKEVLKDIKRRKVNKIICLGDTIAKGNRPSECIKLLKENNVISLMGNCDYYYVIYEEKEFENKLQKLRVDWNKSLLTEEAVEYVKSLKVCYEMKLSGQLIRFFHATPYSVYNITSNQTSDLEEKYKMFLPSEYTQSQEISDISVFGHLHTQFEEKFLNRTLINVGSVGNSLDLVRSDTKDAKLTNTTQAFYLVIEGKLNSKKPAPLSFNYISIPYDLEEVVLVNQINNIESEAYTGEILEGRYRSMDKVYQRYLKAGIDIKSL